MTFIVSDFIGQCIGQAMHTLKVGATPNRP